MGDDRSKEHERPRRVLIGAYACDPEEGSEPGVGWHWSMQAARFADVHVITRSNNRPSIEARLREIESGPIRFHYIDLPAPLRWAKKRTGAYGLLVYYYLWQLKAGRVARRLHRQEPFDLLHHVTFANDWMPSGLANVAGPPLVWGPIGGSTHVAPPEVEATWSQAARRYERIRRSMQQVFIRFDPLLRKTTKRATLTLPYTREAASAPHLRGPNRVVTHIGVDRTGDHSAAEPKEDEPLQVVTGGRLVHWKGQDLVVEAMAGLLDQRPGSARLIVTGKGPALSGLQQLARDLGVADAVDFVGYLPTPDDVLELIASADLYALPTWRDGPPVAILEAMSVGTPPLCLALGATDELVPDGAGLKIRPLPHPSLVERIEAALLWAVDNRGLLREKGKLAAEHASTHHDWHAIGFQIGQVYDDVERMDPAQVR